MRKGAWHIDRPTQTAVHTERS